MKLPDLVLFLTRERQRYLFGLYLIKNQISTWTWFWICVLSMCLFSRYSLNSYYEPRAGDTMLKKRDKVYSPGRRSDKETSIFHRAQTGVALIRDRQLQEQIEEGYQPGPRLSGKTFWKKNV